MKRAFKVIERDTGAVIGAYRLMRQAIDAAASYNEVARSHGLGWITLIDKIEGEGV